MDHNVALPSKPRIVKEEHTSGIFEIDGLFPGYGHTLGNSLRRIILSSLSGAAVTMVKIDGVAHEFSTVEGMREDVVAFLLNIKRLHFSMMTDEPQTVTLDVSGVRTVSGKDLTCPSQVTVLNPDQYLAELTDKHASLSVELTVERGLGYVPRELRNDDKVEVGAIALDATFTPIRRVNYEVENMRVGDRTDFNRLRLFIETDGTITARTALEKSIEIMIHQLKAIIGFKEELHEREEEHTIKTAERAFAPERKAEVSDTESLKTRVESLPLSARTVSALTNANIRTVGGLARKKEEDILAIEGLGIKGLQEIKRALSDFGITLR